MKLYVLYFPDHLHFNKCGNFRLFLELDYDNICIKTNECYLNWNIVINRSYLYIYRRRQWQPTPVLLPGKSHGRRSLVGCSPWEAKSLTRLSDFTFSFHFLALEKEMETHSSVLAWRIPGMEEPGGLPSMGSHRVGHD